jgi:aspartate racemase
MKTIGIIGGLGPPSTVKYYEWLNAGVQARLGGHNAARIILTSVNGADVGAFRVSGDTVAEEEFYAREARRLQDAGADFILIASNTSHKNAPAVQAAVSVPLLHLADATAAHIVRSGYRRVALLGTAPTMEEDFYKSRLIAAGLDIVVPDAAERTAISRTIYGEMVRGIVTADTNAMFARVIRRLVAEEKVEGIILGCTELTLLDLSGIDVPLFDTVKIHVAAAIDFAMDGVAA